MKLYYVPYSGSFPAAMLINGHKLVFLAEEEEAFLDELYRFGADHVQQVEVGESREEQEQAFSSIAQQVDGGIVVAPSDVGLTLPN